MRALTHFVSAQGFTSFEIQGFAALDIYRDPIDLNRRNSQRLQKKILLTLKIRRKLES